MRVFFLQTVKFVFGHHFCLKDFLWLKFFLYGRSPSSESPPKSPVRVSSRNEEQRHAHPLEANHVPTRGQNGDSDIHYVKATEVSSMPANKHRDPIQVLLKMIYVYGYLEYFLTFIMLLRTSTCATLSINLCKDIYYCQDVQCSHIMSDWCFFATQWDSTV